MKHISLIIILSFAFLSLQSQNQPIIGTARDVSGNLPGVVITITAESESDVITYAITDNAGNFVFQNVDMEKGKFIRARLMGYASQAIPIDKNKTNYEFLLVEESIQLNEVMIKAAKISAAGDTTRYLASSFAKENDITLGDVIKRMPGFHVTDAGTIKYQGKDISDFYIEGSNIMGAKYPVAVNSIHQQDIGSVEVIEKHQSIKLFEDLLFSDKTAVNITLKERAKNKWVGLFHIGGGVPNLWSADVNAMRFARKIKMLDTYKGNNTGINVSAIGKTDFNLSGETEPDAREIISMRNIRNPFLEERKTLFNTSHLLSLNNQLLLGKSFVLTPQLDMGISHFNNDMYEEKIYFLENNQTLNISSQQSGRMKQRNLSPTIRLEANTRKLYIHNVLSADMVRKENGVTITGTHPNVENSDADYMNIQNSLNAMFRIGKKVIGVKSLNSWSQRPQDMTIRQNDVSIHQRAKTSVFHSRTSATQTFSLGKSALSLEEGFSLSRQSLQSTLTGIQNYDKAPSIENDFDYNQALLYVKPWLSTNWGDVKTSIEMPISYNYNHYTDALLGKAYNNNKWLLSPSASISWTMNKKYSLSINGGWQKQPASVEQFYTSPILSSYPFIQEGLTDFHQTETANAGIMIRYKNILNGLFWNASYKRMWRNSDLMFTQDFKNNYIVSGWVRNPHTTQFDNLFGSVSYMVDAIKGTLSLRGFYSRSDSYLQQSGNEQYTVSEIKQLSFNMDSSPLRELDINYSTSFSHHLYRLKGAKRQSNNRFNQRISITYIPVEKINFSLIGNHYYTTFESGNKHTFLVDADANYRLSSKWNFRLSMQNLLNQKEFSYISYADMMSLERKYSIRPFSLLVSVITSF